MDKKKHQDDRSYTLCDESEGSEYEFIATPADSISEGKRLPLRPKQDPEPGVQIELHEALEKDGLLISVKPPRQPLGTTGKLKHVPCDIVLTVDVSGSMSAEGPPPVVDPNDAERNGLTVLDLVKHAARTILETLDETDRLAIITFSTEAKVVQRLLYMTAENKTFALNNINALQPDSMTNLWHGILESIKVFADDERSNCVPAIMVLTDGLPNHMCPSQGYVRKIRSYERLPASLHTFGFGFSLRSGLLKSIAEIGGGNYAFIPDSGMLGTVFIHAVANLQSTFATNVSLTLKLPRGLSLEESMGSYIRREGSNSETSDDVVDDNEEESSAWRKSCKTSSPRRKKAKTSTLVLQLDSLQYGQSRDIFLTYRQKPSGSEPPCLDCSIKGRPVDGTLLDMNIQKSRCSSNGSQTEIVYHRARAEVCSLISSIFPLNSLEEHQVTSSVLLDKLCVQVEELATSIKANEITDADIQSLWDDLVGEQPSGQILLALSSTTYFERWGKHYLLSILNAHQKQICNSFKDNGPLQYGVDSPLFIRCRDALDRAFDSLPPPVPSRPPRVRAGQGNTPRVNMSRYHRRDNPCFAEHCLVTMADGTTRPVRNLRRGMSVMTLAGNAKVAAVVATRVEEELLCRVGELEVTLWHPICIDGVWRFLGNKAQNDDFDLFDGIIYSVMLMENRDPNMHTIQVGGQWATTLGHGIVETGDDCRGHPFFGHYEAVAQSLGQLTYLGSDDVLESAGIIRSTETGLARGFKMKQLNSPAVARL